MMKRKDTRVIIHFDLDAFYASVFEAENPRLKTLPLAVQQKHIIVTCNYEARRRGLYKLQLIRDAKRLCPDLVVVLGEDLTRFRNASKAIYRHLAAYSWSGKVESLGFDEIFLDVTDIVDYNVEILNQADLGRSFFHLCRDDPVTGFEYDASRLAGHAYGSPCNLDNEGLDHGKGSEDYANARLLLLRLVLGSHLAMHLRKQLESKMGYTSTVGISTSKLLSKLVGNVNKPDGQTTLLPPYDDDADGNASNVQTFMDSHDIGKVPYIGFKMSRKLREYAARRTSSAHQVPTGETAPLSVAELRSMPGLNAEKLGELLGGPGTPKSIGLRTWQLLHGVDDTEVKEMKTTPKQISIENSYIRLDTFERVRQELASLSTALIRRMRLDLAEDTESLGNDAAADGAMSHASSRRWLAYPKTLRLSTRPRPPPGPDGIRARAFQRVSRSSALPTFVFDLDTPAEELARRLRDNHLILLFKQLHPDSAWDLSLMSVAVSKMMEAAGMSKTATGRDIGRMFAMQESVMKDWRTMDQERQLPFDALNTKNEIEVIPSDSSRSEIGELAGHEASQRQPETQPGRISIKLENSRGTEDGYLPQMLSFSTPLTEAESTSADEDDREDASFVACPLCQALMPEFAMQSHLRFHEAGG